MDGRRMTGLSIYPPAAMGLAMSLWEVSLRTQYDYPFIEMSGKYPGVPISMWCVWDRELIQVPSQDEAVLEGIEKEIRKAGRIVDRWAEAGWFGIARTAERGVRQLITGVRRHHGPEGVLGRTWPTGSMAFWTTIMLAAYLILSYL